MSVQVLELSTGRSVIPVQSAIRDTSPVSETVQIPIAEEVNWCKFACSKGKWLRCTIITQDELVLINSPSPPSVWPGVLFN